MKKYFFILTALLVFAGVLNAQSIDKAQKQMDKYNYAKAIEILKKAADEEKTKSQALPMLAECYRQQRDINKTSETYAKVVTLPEVKPEYYFYYAKALQSTGNYVLAREMFLKYAEKNPADPKGKLFASHCDSILGPWNNLKAEYEVKIANNINTTESDFGPAIYDGELVFASDFTDSKGGGESYGWTGRGYLNIKRARPLSAGDFWGSLGAPSELEGDFNQEYHDGPAAFSIDGNSIYFTRSFFGKAKREGIFKTNQLKIYYSTQTNGTWGEVKPFEHNSIEYSVGHPALSPDGQTLYFVSDMPGGSGGTDIWMCKREGDEWSKPTNMGPVINTSENEMFPSMNEDNVLYFASEGHAGYGALDIFKSNNINGAWTTPVNLQKPINSSYDDFAFAFAPGLKNGFISSNRPGGKGSDDIYAFREVVLPSFISGFVKDANTLLPMAGATVFVLNPTSGSVKVLVTDANGMYKTQVENPENYTVKAMMANFIADCTPFHLSKLIPGETSIAPRDLLLNRLIINKTFRIENIYYDFDKYKIRDDAKAELDKLVQIMNENPIEVELGSHTDCRGTFEYNDKLSQKRANAAVKYIIKSGIDEARITAKGYGERQLTNKCADDVNCTPEEHQANRRTEFKVTGYSAPAVNADQFDYGKYQDGMIIESKSLPKGFFPECR